jgi:hypothetical protein
MNITTPTYCIAIISVLTGCSLCLSLPSIAADANNVPLASVIKLEEKPTHNNTQHTPENFAVGGIDTATATQQAHQGNNPWQNILALLAVSASAWWILNTAWFKQLAQQRQALHLAQQNKGYLTQHHSTVPPSPRNQLLQTSIQWLKTHFIQPDRNTEEKPLPIANILQTVELSHGQSLVLVKVGNNILGIGTGSTHPVLLEQWEAASLYPEPPNHNGLTPTQTPEKWMAQSPPIPSINDTEPTTYPQPDLEIIADYETLNQTEQALFSQLLQPESRV